MTAHYFKKDFLQISKSIIFIAASELKSAVFEVADPVNSFLQISKSAKSILPLQSESP